MTSGADAGRNWMTPQMWLGIAVLAVSAIASQTLIAQRSDATMEERIKSMQVTIQTEGSHTRELAKLQFDAMTTQIRTLSDRINALESRTHNLETGKSTIYTVPPKGP